MKTKTAEFTIKVRVNVKYCQINPEYLDGEIREPDVTKDTVADYIRALIEMAESEGYFEEFCSAEPVDIKIEVS